MRRLLLASDFDGTLAPIQHHPGEVAIDATARDLLQKASALGSVDVAFLSGRDLDDLTRRTSDIRAWRSGSHGREVSDPDGHVIEAGRRLATRPDPLWIEEARLAGIRLEEKHYGVAAHWRGSESVAREHPSLRSFEEWARSSGLELVEGRCVLEARLPGPDKKDALADLAFRTHAGRVLFAGDDLTDFPALEWAASRGRALFVRSAERTEQPPPGVETVRSLPHLLEVFESELRQHEKQRAFSEDRSVR